MMFAGVKQLFLYLFVSVADVFIAQKCFLKGNLFFMPCQGVPTANVRTFPRLHFTAVCF